MANTGDAHLLQIIVLQRNQGFADDLVFCTGLLEHFWRPTWHRAAPTYKAIGILLQADGCDEIRTLVGGPFGYDGLGQPVGTAPIAIGRRGMLVRRRIGLGGRDGDIGGVYGRAVLDVSLVLVVGIRLGIGRPGGEAHGHGDGVGAPNRGPRNAPYLAREILMAGVVCRLVSAEQRWECDDATGQPWKMAGTEGRCRNGIGKG